MTEPTTHTIDVPGAVCRRTCASPPAERARPLFVFGSPMAASGFRSWCPTWTTGR